MTTFGISTSLRIAALLWTCNCLAATYHVAPLGLDTNPGSEVLPLRTVQRAVNLAAPGDTIELAPGVYPEQVTTARSGTHSSRIVINGRSDATIHRLLIGHEYLTVQNLRISGYTTKFGQLVNLGPGAHWTILSNLWVDPNRALQVQGIGAFLGDSNPPFDPRAPSNCLLISNTVTRVLGAVCITVAGQNNHIVGNTISNVFQADIFRLFGKSNILTGNLAIGNYSDPASGFHMDIIQTFGQNGRGSLGHLIANNTFLDMPGCQIAQLEPDGVADIGDWTFQNNVFRGIGMGSSFLIPGTRLLNNLFINCNTNLGGQPINIGVDIDGGKADRCEVQNNIFIDNGDSRKTVGWYNIDRTLTGVVADFNYVSKQNNGPVQSGSIAVGNGTHDNFAFYEPHGVNGGDPGFQALPDNFRLLSHSILVDRGTAASTLLSDADGIPRPQGRNWDIGPFEASIGVQRPSPPRNLTTR